MNKLIIAIAAMLAATFFTGNAFAFSGGHARGVHASSAAAKVSDVYARPHARRAHHVHSYNAYPSCECGHMLYSCSTFCNSCGCGCGGFFGGGSGCGCGCGGGCGFPLLGWFFQCSASGEVFASPGSDARFA